MHKLIPHKTGLAFGAFIGFIHLVWVVLMGTGLALGWIKFVLGMHFLSIPVEATAFSWKGGLILIVLTSIVGYVFGTVFSLFWNRLAAKA